MSHTGISAQRVPEPDPLPATPSFSFENHLIAGNTKYWVISDISGKPEVLDISNIFRVFPDMTGWLFHVKHHDGLGYWFAAPLRISSINERKILLTTSKKEMIS